MQKSFIYLNNQRSITMKDKYNLPLKENIFLAKKLLLDNIYHSARLEGCNITFSDTQTILNGVSVGKLKMQDVGRCIK